MDKARHAALLRTAMARSGTSRNAVADYVGVTVRTVTNWTSKKNPMVPAEAQRIKLREMLGPYDTHGDADPVEAAVRQSRLVEWRQDDTIAHYKRHLYEQAREEAV